MGQKHQNFDFNKIQSKSVEDYDLHDPDSMAKTIYKAKEPQKIGQTYDSVPKASEQSEEDDEDKFSVKWYNSSINDTLANCSSMRRQLDSVPNESMGGVSEIRYQEPKKIYESKKFVKIRKANHSVEYPIHEESSIKKVG